MKLDEKILRLAESIDSEVARMLEKHRARIASYDDVAHDERNGRLTYRKGDEIIYNALSEEIATVGGDGTLSWGWSQRPGYVKKTRRVEVAKSLFEGLALTQLLADEIPLEDRSNAERLVRIVLSSSHADGVFRVERGSRTIYFALFESGGATAPANKVPTGKLVRRMTPPVGSVRVSSVPAMVAPSTPSPPGPVRTTASGSMQAATARPLPREEGSAPRIETVLPRRTASGTLPAASAAVAASYAPPSQRSPSQTNEVNHPASQRVLRNEPSRPPNSQPVPSTRPSNSQPVPSTRPTLSQSVPAARQPITQPAPSARRSVDAPPPSQRPSPTPSAPAREPSRGVFMPVAQAVFSDIAAVLPGRITQAILILNVQRRDQKAFTLEVVAMDAEGKFRAVEASRELRKVVGDMIAVDESGGNGSWRRLVAYISMKDGASLNFEVK